MGRLRVHFQGGNGDFRYTSEFRDVDLMMFRQMDDVAWRVPKEGRMLWVNPDKALAIEVAPDDE